jgi:hypothetical protein
VERIRCMSKQRAMRCMCEGVHMWTRNGGHDQHLPLQSQLDLRAGVSCTERCSCAARMHRNSVSQAFTCHPLANDAQWLRELEPVSPPMMCPDARNVCQPKSRFIYASYPMLWKAVAKRSDLILMNTMMSTA